LLRRIENMLVELREKVAQVRRRREDPSLPAPVDEEDAKALAALQEKVRPTHCVCWQSRDVFARHICTGRLLSAPYRAT
jgi:hypothetical protein